MGRRLDFPEVYGILRRFRTECPHLYLLADIIVGFPGETPEMFEELVSFFKKDTVFDMISHFGYSDVQGAPSSKLNGKVDSLQIGRRWDLLRKVLGKRSFYNAMEKSDTDRAIYLISLESDYVFCKGTYLKE